MIELKSFKIQLDKQGLVCACFAMAACSGTTETPYTVYKDESAAAYQAAIYEQPATVELPTTPGDLSGAPQKQQYEYTLQAAEYAKTQGNKSEMIELYELAASQGSPDAHYELARMLSKGDGLARDVSLANEHLKASAELGSPDALRVQAWKRLRGDDGPADKAEGLEMMERAAQSSVRAQRELGMLYVNVYKPHLDDIERGKTYLRLAYEAGDVEAAYQLGRVLISQAENIEAIEVLSFAAEGGSTKAYQVLKSLDPGAANDMHPVQSSSTMSPEQMYQKANSIMLRKHSSQEEAQAYALYSLASDQGHQLAAQELKMLDGIKVVRDRTDPNWLEREKANVSGMGKSN